MLVKDIIKLACSFIGQTSLEKALDEEATLSEDEQLICDSLVNFFNLVYNEVACEYIPIYNKERVKCEDFKVKFSSLTENPLQIISVKDICGRKVKFKVFDDHLVAIASAVDVLYSVQPKSYQLSERLYKVLDMLDPDQFLRISNSVVIARNKVKSISPTLSMKFILTMQNGKKVDVTRSYYYIFKEYFGI